MSQFDFIQRFLIDHSPVRGEVVRLKDSFQKVLDKHDYPAPIQKQLGEMLAAVALLTATVKIDGILSLQARGSGSCSLLMAESNPGGDLRAIARWEGDIGQPETLQQLMGNGQLVITMEPKNGQRYQGIVSLQGETLAHCLEQYFEQSEQLPSRLWLNAEQGIASGFMLQALPSENTEQDKDAWERAVSLAETLTNEELSTLAFEDLLHRLYHQEEIRIFDASALQFNCTCSEDRVKKAMISVGKEELLEVIEERGSLESQCQFCNTLYRFNAADVESMFDDPDAPSPVLH
ncbi:Hsp33 family molecular chaperone HslO [Oceanospirillum sediminis]|uniref:33 kDa chaperonin n=1 Tax=Oceanospirillum sediminis TaxID=2760088 RepID=A0A839IKV4_9GAMM|nr:Hsp33 family molecular chaperone HslO [Oceanospirillum sediminis]MBB1485127.1 Hsp33 family molecular chaperone HslO [Oceanospirillum sediminis]